MTLQFVNHHVRVLALQQALEELLMRIDYDHGLCKSVATIESLVTRKDLRGARFILECSKNGNGNLAGAL